MQLTFLAQLAWLVVLICTACSTDPAAEVVDSAVIADARDASADECADEGSTRACTCKSGVPGRKSCHKGKYGVCGSCFEEPSDAGRPGTPGVVQCKAGYYVGEMSGEYKPGFASLGIAESPFSVHFESQALNGQPPLSLTLDENASGPVGEFYSYTVNGGCMQGLARSGATDNPFVARLTGTLDCDTGSFVGVMEGRYTLLSVQGLDFNFKGPITAQFVASGAKLADGEWSVDEPPALNGQPAGGGSGTWSAAWVADGAPDAGADPCQDIVSTGPLDAGVDAGS